MNARLQPSFRTMIARTAGDVLAAQRLRYEVFIAELGGDGPGVDHDTRIETDQFDTHADHILLLDENRPDGDQVVGVYRVMTTQMAASAGQFYCEDEYNLVPLRSSGKRLLELGRSCLHADYRGGAGMLHLWSALADYVVDHRIDVLFGAASFHGTDAGALAAPLSLLHHRHLAQPPICAKAKGPTAMSMNMMPEDEIDRVAAVRALPALIKAYLRLGGTVGDGAFVDNAFNTVDILLILENDAISALQRSIYTKGGVRG
jgi:putative hemolysin